MNGSSHNRLWRFGAVPQIAQCVDDQFVEPVLSFPRHAPFLLCLYFLGISSIRSSCVKIVLGVDSSAICFVEQARPNNAAKLWRTVIYPAHRFPDLFTIPSVRYPLNERLLFLARHDPPFMATSSLG